MTISDIIKKGEEEFNRQFLDITMKIINTDGTRSEVYAGNKIKSHNRTQARAIIEACIEIIESKKCDERKIKEFGDFVAETYDEKMLVNSALTQVVEKLKIEL